MNKQEFKSFQRARSEVYQAAKSSLLMEVREAAAVQAKRMTALRHRQRVRFLTERELRKREEDERKLWQGVRAFKDLRSKREKAEAKRKAEIVRRRRDYWKAYHAAKRRERARARMEAMNIRSVEARRRKMIATEKLLTYAPDYVFDLIGQTVAFQQNRTSNCGMLRGKVEGFRQHHGCILLSVRVPHSGGLRNLYEVSLKNVIIC
jgi:hypothetical protein